MACKKSFMVILILAALLGQKSFYHAEASRLLRKHPLPTPPSIGRYYVVINRYKKTETEAFRPTSPGHSPGAGHGEPPGVAEWLSPHDGIDAEDSFVELLHALSGIFVVAFSNAGSKKSKQNIFLSRFRFHIRKKKNKSMITFSSICHLLIIFSYSNPHLFFFLHYYSKQSWSPCECFGY